MAKRKAGQPQKFQTVEEMQSAIDEYFDYCDNRIVQVYSKSRDEVIEVIKPEPYTIEGLCLTLDVDRKTLLNYEKAEGYEKFFHTVKKAKMRVQKGLVLNTLEGQAAGGIFNLKNNFGYKDSTEVDNNHNFPKGVNINFIKAKGIADSGK